MALTPPAPGTRADTARWGRRETLETWLVVQVFRDWLAHRINAAKAAGRPWAGAHFRLMRRGGEAYLPAAEVVETLKHYLGERAGREGKGRLGSGWEMVAGDERWEEVKGDLALLKGFARGVVVGLCVCEGVVVEGGEGEGEGEDEGLRCTKVEVGELPWGSGGEGDSE